MHVGKSPSHTDYDNNNVRGDALPRPEKPLKSKRRVTISALSVISFLRVIPSF
jgi:hypothetical protein